MVRPFRDLRLGSGESEAAGYFGLDRLNQRAGPARIVVLFPIVQLAVVHLNEAIHHGAVCVKRVCHFDLLSGRLLAP
jgi:hypothetical protein